MSLEPGVVGFIATIVFFLLAVLSAIAIGRRRQMDELANELATSSDIFVPVKLRDLSRFVPAERLQYVSTADLTALLNDTKIGNDISWYDGTEPILSEEDDRMKRLRFDIMVELSRRAD